MAGADRFKAATVSIGRRRGRIAVMAAKVVMVAVPTVLGIASIRVYTVKEAPADGLVSPDRLNIYAPLLGADPPTVVPERPGLVERGLTTTRESVLPAVRAVKDACVSVTRGGVNLYHAGEDVYYYLIDPPPGFLPRFGTVTMAGLLGMFLARKGSRFKRLAVPLGLMSAGASLCYPVQAVSVLKVTGQKVYAAGQWSSAAASSLLAAREPVAKEAAAPQPQPRSEADPESTLRDDEASADLSTPDLSTPDLSTPDLSTPDLSTPDLSTPDLSTPDLSTPDLSTPNLLAESVAVSEAEVESAEFAPISEEPVVTEEPPVALTGTPPAEIGWSAHSEPVQTEPSRPASDENRASDDVSLDLTPADAVQDEPAEGNLPSASALESAAEFEPAEEQQSLPAAEETPTSTPATAPAPQQPAEGSREEGSGFQPDPALMDFGQSSPEDEDLYSTRS
ncbi:MICOS complex subunit MIC27 [Gambusia affinis]|uniref:MICOS complex subunit MIC27 n=1 Tax=Gambusia affinis TaxID=33528 RepID=UPI001CDD0CD3|nr:MICOS complex subunit MIC27 [Gambusia affinis]